MGVATDSTPDTAEPARREVPDKGLRGFPICEWHTCGVVSYLLSGKSQVVQRGGRHREKSASGQQAERVAAAILTAGDGWRRSRRWKRHCNIRT